MGKVGDGESGLVWKGNLEQNEDEQKGEKRQGLHFREWLSDTTKVLAQNGFSCPVPITINMPKTGEQLHFSHLPVPIA